MQLSNSLLLAVASLAASIAAHGYPQSIVMNTETYFGFLPDTDNYQKPNPSKIVRRIPNDGPVLDYTSTNLTCNVGAQDAEWLTTSHGIVAAGSDVTFSWNRWESDHRGPVTTWMAACGSDCSSFDPTSGNVWFKIDEAGLLNGTTDTGNWASIQLLNNNISWTVTIPKDLQAGAYIVRQEILALHSAGAPQFYPSCAQVIVTGSGTSTPSSDELVAIPGIYTSDVSTMIDIWQNGQTIYPIAGPAVTKLQSYNGTNPINLGSGAPGVPYVAGQIVTNAAAAGATASSTSVNGTSAAANVTTSSSDSTSTTLNSTSIPLNSTLTTLNTTTPLNSTSITTNSSVAAMPIGVTNVDSNSSCSVVTTTVTVTQLVYATDATQVVSSSSIVIPTAVTSPAVDSADDGTTTLVPNPTPTASPIVSASADAVLTTTASTSSVVSTAQPTTEVISNNASSSGTSSCPAKKKKRAPKGLDRRSRKRHEKNGKKRLAY